MLLFFAIWHWTLVIIGCALNLILIYVAIFKSSKAIRSYATLIINFAITDFIECAFDWFVLLRVMPVYGELALTYIMNGPCKYFGAQTCKISASIYLHCLPHSVWSLLLSFGYRYWILKKGALSRSVLIKIVLIVYVPSLFQALTYWRDFVDTSEILPLAEKWFPEYEFEKETGILTGFLDVTRWASAYGIFHITIPIYPVYTAIFILRKKIIQHLEANANVMSKETKAAHSQLLLALTVQALIPGIMSVAVCCFFLEMSGLIISPIMEETISSIVLMMPAFSPLTNLVFIRPYRLYLTKRFRKSKQEEHSSNFASTMSSGSFVKS